MIDPDEAPEGYRAEKHGEDHPCDGCDLRFTPKCYGACCMPHLRRDKRHVIFKRTGPVMAIYATPCDDMGAHV